MCFNASVMADAGIIQEIYGSRFLEERFDRPAWFRSAFEHPAWPVLKQGEPAEFQALVWGLIPRWSKSADDARSIRDKTINARFETIDSKPSFRSLVNRRRCGVLVDGFVEWRSFNKEKYPYHICLPEKRPFMLAGLWDRWEDAESDTVVESFTVITVDARGLPAQIHNTRLRMPLILGKTSGELWLQPDLPFAEIRPQVQPVYKSLVAWPVSKKVSRPGEQKNLPDIQDPVEYPGLPPLEPV